MADTWHVSDYSLFGEGVPLGGWLWYYCVWYVKTNHRCISHHLATIYDARFETRLWVLSLE